MGQPFPLDELKVIDSTIRCFTEPCLRLDRPRMEKFLLAERIRKAKAMLTAGNAIGLPFMGGEHSSSSWENGDARRPGNHETLTAEAGWTPAPSRPDISGLKAHLDRIETELQSADKFRLALESLGCPCPMKWSAKQECEIPALAKNDDGMKELLEHGDGRVAALASARLGVKSTIDETRAERLLASDRRGALPVYLSYAAAKTLRFGGGDKTNWQNFRRGGEIRQSILAPEGHKLVIADAGQVECRGLNKMAGERWVINAFAEGRDIYCEMATKAYGRVVTPEDKMGRFGGKTLELGCGYGLGWRKYQRQMRQGMLGGPPVILSDERAQNDVNAYRATHPAVKAMWGIFGKHILSALANGTETTYDCLRIKDHRIYLPNGAWLDYTGMYWGFYEDTPQPNEEPQWWHSGRREKVKYYGGKLVENVIQALWSGLFIRQAMNAITARGFKIVLQVHDEIICCVPDSRAEECYEFMLDTLETPPPWCPEIPLRAEGIISENYSK